MYCILKDDFKIDNKMMDFKIELTKCSKCDLQSYPESNETPYICYDCQWYDAIANGIIADDIPIKCLDCDKYLITSQKNARCVPCHADKYIHEVHPGVFITDYRTSQYYDELKKRGIKQILTIAKELEKHDHPDFVSEYISVDDHPDADIKQYFQRTHDFISNAPTLVHCYAGISRSASIVISYIMKQKSIDAWDAIAHCKRIRPIINPNRGFVQQLVNYSDELGLLKSDTSEIFAMDDIPVNSYTTTPTMVNPYTTTVPKEVLLESIEDIEDSTAALLPTIDEIVKSFTKIGLK